MPSCCPICGKPFDPDVLILTCCNQRYHRDPRTDPEHVRLSRPGERCPDAIERLVNGLLAARWFWTVRKEVA